MQTSEPKNGTPKPQGIPVRTVLIIALVLAVLSIGALGFVLYRATNAKAKLEREAQAWEAQKKQADIESQKAAEQLRLDQERAANEAKLALARSRQSECLLLVRNATNALWNLREDLERVTTEAAALRTNEAGRGIARFPELVVLARRLYESEVSGLPQPQVVITRLEGERRFEQQLMSAAGTAYEPDPNFVRTAQADAIWAAQESGKVERAATLIATLIQESKVKIPTDTAADPGSLEAAIGAVIQNEAALRQRLITEQTAEARARANDELAKAEVERVREESRLEIANLRAELAALRSKEEQKTALEAAERQIEENKGKVAVANAEKEARKVQLRQKAEDPKIRAKLAPFLAPGYVQFDGTSYEKQPISYSALQASGALIQNQDGLQKIAIIGWSRGDKVRPRWSFRYNNERGWQRTTEDREMVTEAQQLLIDLGEIFVEMGLLRP